MKFILLLFAALTFGQVSLVSIKINTITNADENPARRIFKIDYQIENNTDKEVQFFLKPNTLIAQAASSMTLFIVYKIYRNGAYESMDGPFYEKIYDEQEEVFDITDYKSPKAIAYILKIKEKYEQLRQDYINEYKNTNGENKDEIWILKNQKLLKSIVTLKPNEVKYFTIETSWRRNRYFKIEDEEYYLNENDKFEIQLNLILNKSDRKEFLTNEEFLKIKNNPNFLEGTFQSNLKELSFN